MYYHLVGIPKPWQWWTQLSLRRYGQIMEIVHWLLDRNVLHFSLPPALNPRLSALHYHTIGIGYAFRAYQKLKRVLSI